ncbi:MAG: phosphoethanolamine--lipid A transferase [Burkholderiaceae bacterium]
MRVPAFLKPSLNSPLTLVWLASLWIGLLCNWPLWQKLASLPELGNARGLAFTAAFAGIVICLQGALLSLLAWRRILKPLLAFVLLSSAAIVHFIGSYGIVIDQSMVINTLQTDVREAGDLLSLRLLLTLLLLAGLPIVWLWRRPLERQPLPGRLGRNLLGFAGGIALGVLLALSCFADLASTMRNYKELRYMVTPLNAYYAGIALALKSQAAPQGPPAVVGADAVLAPRPAGAKPPLLLLVVGETARADHFALNGYPRATNPGLAALPVLSYRNASSCGTSTAASLPCMFSPLGREAYLQQKAPQENLLDVLQRAGLAVFWLDNQAGCKGVCERVPSSDTKTAAPGARPLPAGLCDGEGECLDAALLEGLDERLAALDPARVARGVVLVMHQMGSHGPAYYKRSPADAKPFQPECRSNALQQCPRDELLNAYDNTIAYTDRLLTGAIHWLERQQTRFAPGLLYMSDHGESLGENNLYLHGMPYSLAPKEQKHIPAIVWLPEATAASQGVSSECLRSHLDDAISHDDLSHTALGFTGVKTQLYRPDWDLLQRCRQRSGG